MKRRRLTALLVTDITDIRYLTGFTGSSAYAVITREGSFFLTDTRYSTQARSEVYGGFRLTVYKRRGLDAALLALRGARGAVAFEGERLSYEDYARVKKALKRASLKSVPGLVARIRAVKDPSEIELMLSAARILDSGYRRAEKVLAPGVPERDVALAIEWEMRRRGADGVAFTTIVASGPRGALPHGKASDKKIESGELVVIDAGASFRGYNSDQTRTYCVGRPTALQKKIYRTVLGAQALAIEKIRAGVRASDVDRAARGFIRKAGYGKFFGHSTGHGVGLEVHERPTIGPRSRDVLEEGMVVTVEPGIYLPGVGGVRIEDMVLVKRGGYEVLTSTPKELLSL